MYPAEAVVKLLSRRSTRDDFQVLAASATLDRATRKKVSKLLRPSQAFAGHAAGEVLPVASSLPPQEEEDDDATEVAELPSAALVAAGATTAERVAALVAQTEAEEARAAAARAATKVDRARWTAVPPGIRHVTRALRRADTAAGEDA